LDSTVLAILRRGNDCRVAYDHPPYQSPSWDQAREFYIGACILLEQLYPDDDGTIYPYLPPQEFKEVIFSQGATPTEVGLHWYESAELGVSILVPRHARTSEGDSFARFFFTRCLVTIMKDTVAVSSFDPDTYFVEDDFPYLNFAVNRQLGEPARMRVNSREGIRGSYAYETSGKVACVGLHTLLWAPGSADIEVVSLDISGAMAPFKKCERMFDFILEHSRVYEPTAPYAVGDATEWVHEMVETEYTGKPSKVWRCDSEEAPVPHLRTEDGLDLYPSIVWGDDERSKIVGAAEVARAATITRSKAEQWRLMASQVPDFRVFVPEQLGREARQVLTEEDCSLFSLRFLKAGGFLVTQEWKRRSTV